MQPSTHTIGLLNLTVFSLIYGFCSKDKAEHLLQECRHPTLLIRFSDTEFVKIKISVRDSSGGMSTGAHSVPS